MFSLFEFGVTKLKKKKNYYYFLDNRKCWFCLQGSRTVDIWAVQCDKCYKWRKIHSQEEFEEIRSKSLEDPFFCGKKPNLTCDNPTDMEHDSSRVWVADKPNIPKTPPGFKRRLVMRKDYTRMDIYYTTPTGKSLRSSTEAASFLKDNPEFKDLSPSDFCFTRPKIIEDSTKNTQEQG